MALQMALHKEQQRARHSVLSKGEPKDESRAVQKTFQTVDQKALQTIDQRAQKADRRVHRIAILTTLQ